MSDEGMKTRREVLGDEHVDRARASATPFTEPFQEYVTRAAWGQVWARPGLDLRTRSCLTRTSCFISGLPSRPCSSTSGYEAGTMNWA